MRGRGWLVFSLLLFGMMLVAVTTSLFSGQDIPVASPAISRGTIYDFESRLLATSKLVKGLFLEPRAFVATPQNIARLAQATGISSKSLRLFLVQKKGPFLLKKEVSPKMEEELAGLPGVLFLNYYQRLYPFATATAAFLGQISPGGRGIFGIEASYEALLKDPRTSLRTAIDLDLQERFYQDLKRDLHIFQARQGAGAVMELQTGRLLALVSTSPLNPLLRDTISLRLLAPPLEKTFKQGTYADRVVFLRELGFGAPTHIDLPGESVGFLPPEVEDYAEVQATPLQMLRALSALATGKLYTPRVVWEVRTRTKTYIVKTGGQVLKNFKPLARGGLWWSGGNRQAGYFFLAGLWPRRHPQLAYVLYVKGVRVWGLPVYPSRLVPSALAAYHAPVSRKEIQTAKSSSLMPDVRGLTLRAALERLVPLGLQVKFSGFGVTIKQWPPPGTPLKKVRECRLVLDDDV